MLGPILAAYMVSTALGAQQALPKLKAGDTLCLFPGTYGPIAIQGLKLPVGTTSFGPCKPGTVQLAGLALYQTQGLVVSDFGISAYKTAAVRCYGCIRVTFDGDRVVGVQPNAGITLDGGSQITILNLSATGVRNAVNLGRGVDGWLIDGVEVSGFTDGVFISNSPNGTLQNLTCRDAAILPGDHADCVQGTTKAGAGPLVNLKISHVLSVRGKGDPTQGIFLADEGRLGYRNVQVSDTTIVGSLYNAVYLENADVASSVNKVCAIGLPDFPAGIYRVGPAKVTNSLANQFKFPLRPTDTGNQLAPQATGETEALARCALR